MRCDIHAPMKTLFLLALFSSPLLAQAEEGVVKFYNPVKGFGFITPIEGTRDLVFYTADILSPVNDEELENGNCVSFDREEKMARNVVKIDCE